MCNRSLFIIIFRRNVYNIIYYTRAQTDFVYMVAKPDRPSVWTLDDERARTRVSVCVCGPGRRDAHARSSLSRRATGNISSIPENAVAAMEASVPVGKRWGGGEGVARGIAAEPASNAQRGGVCVCVCVCQTPGGGPVCLDARYADHPSSPKHHSTHHPAAATYRHRLTTPYGSKNRVHHRLVNLPVLCTHYIIHNTHCILLSSSTYSFGVRTSAKQPPSHGRVGKPVADGWTTPITADASATTHVSCSGAKRVKICY